jgi:acyl transferase domain-containing protein
MPVQSAEPVAVLGLSCRLPGADGPEQFWRLLRGGADAIREASDERWPRAVLPDYRRGGFLEHVDLFDAEFFGIDPAEAAAMDPQQRLALELAWHALEDARIVPATLATTAVGVFAAAVADDYALLADRRGYAGLTRHSYPGTFRAMIANRVSYALGLHGPSLTVDTGQSSSLVAVHLACESLRSGESELAIAGGLHLNLLAETTLAIGEFGALSPDGRCHVFDARANGYVRGEGGALVVLKPLAAALRDGDPVRCVILGSAVNNDGGGDTLTAPTAAAQQRVIERAHAQAGIAPDEVGYVELHGTGTRVGDPIEASALGDALGRARRAEPLPVGSVKGNIGHLEAAAGIAGLVKAVLAAEHGELPATVGYQTPNPDIALDELGLDIVAAPCEWPRPDRPRVAGVSSFGMGGTNCHVVLRGVHHEALPRTAPATAPSTAPSTAVGLPWLLSARTPGALRAQARTLTDAPSEAPAPDVALALARTRAPLARRAALLGPDPVAALAALAGGTPSADVVTGVVTDGPITLVFPGQGSQWVGMGRQLIRESAEFAAGVHDCAAALAEFVDWSVQDVLTGAPGAADLDRVDVVQPALWVVLVSLAWVWRAAGVHPDLVIGHSQGEIAAATTVGALSLADGARIVALRSRALAEIAGTGGMLSVATTPEIAQQAVAAHAPGATLAALNGPRSVVLSGTSAELAELQGQLTVAGYRTKLVPVDYASHSPVVERLRDHLRAVLAPVRPRSVDAVFVSTLTGKPLDTADLDAEYWYAGLRETVRFEPAVRYAVEAGCRRFVE